MVTLLILRVLSHLRWGHCLNVKDDYLEELIGQKPLATLRCVPLPVFGAEPANIDLVANLDCHEVLTKLNGTGVALSHQR